jgi:nickel-type superoxide dismutase maturation protease
MEPALRPGDWLLVWRGLRRSGLRIRPGQLVIARHPARADLLLVKRATAHQPEGWWLESDNSAAAGVVDSRSFGPVPAGLIEGTVLLRYGSSAAGRART